MKKQEKGITLIALIISIIILLILAAVTINAITGDGIIAKAQQAAEDYKTKADEEASLLDSYLAQLEEADGSGSGTGGGTGTIQIGVKYTSNTKLTDGNGDNFWVPSGYKVVLDEDGKALVDKGLVIQDDNGNQWVWIPAIVSEISEVIDGKNVGKLYSFSSTGATARTYSTSSFYEPGSSAEIENGVGDGLPSEGEQAEFDAMIDSVSTYGGYYIGRYENGIKDGNVVIQKGATLTASTNTTNILANDKVFVSTIWGCQWDNTLRWLVSSGNKTYEELINSKYWGNYDPSYFDFGEEEETWVENTYWDDTMLNEYDNTYGDWNTTGEWVTTYVPGDDDWYSAPEGLGTKCTTGSSEVWKAGNIYDLAGNGNEYTREYSNRGEYVVSHTVRGGYWGMSEWSTDYENIENVTERETWCYEGDTTRMTLMIK